MATEITMPGTPPDWVNGLMGVVLRTPMLQRLVGRMFALMTVTGAKTGRPYTMPVQYLRHDGEFVVLSQRMRRWWKNVRTRPDVEMRIEGRPVRGRARIVSGGEAHSVLADCLRADPRVAQFYGVELDTAGGIRAEDVDRLLEHVAVIVVTPQPFDSELKPADVVIQGF